MHNIYVGGSIISVSYNTTSFTLSCVTSDGIAAYINKDDCNSKQQLVSFIQQVMDPLTLRYNNLLRWRSQGEGSYICSNRNRDAASYAVLLTEFGVGKSSQWYYRLLNQVINKQSDQESCSSQIVGTLGHELTLLCLANEPVTGAVWINGGERYSNNITVAHLSPSNAGKYICHGIVRNQTISSVVDLRISSEF